VASTFRDLGTDEADGTDKASGPDANHGGGSGIVTQDRRTGDQQVPAPNASTPTPGHKSSDASECGQLSLLEQMFIPRPDSTAATRTRRWGLYASAERAMRSQHS